MKIRLDQYIFSLYPHLTRTFIQSLIMQGKVKVNDVVVTKAGTPVSSDAQIALDLSSEKFVSRAGYKLEKALSHFKCSVTDGVVLDAGLSTGGFTDCLLQAGARTVYGIDVGYGQVHEKIRHDPRVIVMERVNLRNLKGLPELVDMVTLDLSFISVLKVIENITQFLKPQAQLIVLIKPQFEAERFQVGRGGIIKDPTVHQAVIQKVIAGIETHGFVCQGYIDSPITGTDGNKEFLAYFLYR